MLPPTFAALAVVALAVLPGAVYVWSFERTAGAFGANLSDRLLRLLGVSAAIQLLAAWPEYGIYRLLRDEWPNLAAGQFALLWAAFILLVMSPAVVGAWTGWRSRQKRDGRIRDVLGRSEQAPTAWDHFFRSRPNVYLRVRTVNNEWVAGRFAKDSYAGGSPNATDLLLEETFNLDRASLKLDKPCGYMTFIPASQIAWIEILRPRSEDGEERLHVA